MSNAITRRMDREIEKSQCELMAHCGFGYQAISNATGLSFSQIAVTNKVAGVSVRAYRRGEGPVGSLLLKKLGTTPLLEVKQIQKRLTAK
jgi:hypothetical protein